VSRYNFKSVDLPLTKIPRPLRPVKDDLTLKTSGVHSAPWECGEVIIGQTDRSTDTGTKEDHRYIRLEQPERSALAEHRINPD
jgi:hypothetical protein